MKETDPNDEDEWSIDVYIKKWSRTSRGEISDNYKNKQFHNAVYKIIGLFVGDFYF